MSVITGVIETVSIRDGSSRKGPWKLTSAKVDGEWFKTFNGDLGKQLVALEREVVELEYESKENGEYTDNVVKSVKKAQTPEVQKAFTEATTTRQGVDTRDVVQDSRYFAPANSKDTNIAKAVALKAAVDAIEFGAYDTLDKYVADVGRLSDCFVSWLQNGSGATLSPSQGEIDLVVKETETSLPGTF